MPLSSSLLTALICATPNASIACMEGLKVPDKDLIHCLRCKVTQPAEHPVC